MLSDLNQTLLKSDLGLWKSSVIHLGPNLQIQIVLQTLANRDVHLKLCCKQTVSLCRAVYLHLHVIFRGKCAHICVAFS